MLASQHFSWVEQSILLIHQLAKSWGECQVPCVPGANQLALGMLRSLQSQAKGRRHHEGAGWLLDLELETLLSPGSCVICTAAAGDLRTWQRGQLACQIYFGLSGKVTNWFLWSISVWLHQDFPMWNWGCCWDWCPASQRKVKDLGTM